MAAKKTFRVTGHVTISVSTVVEAKNAEEAIDKAAEHGMQSFCHQCSSEDDKSQWVIGGELDGEVVEMRAEEE